MPKSSCAAAVMRTAMVDLSFTGVRGCESSFMDQYEKNGANNPIIQKEQLRDSWTLPPETHLFWANDES